MEHPETLTPRSIEPIELLRSDREVMVPKATPRFRPWLAKRNRNRPIIIRNPF